MIGSALLLAGCAPKPVANRLRIGSLNSDENETLADIFAIALEREGVAVARQTRIAGESSAIAALQRGQIDIFPGLVQTGVTKYNARVRRYGIMSLAPSPANDSPCLLTSQYAAEEFWLLRLTKCSAIASQLRLAATPDFVAPGGELEGLRRQYGGFNFKSIVECDEGTQLYRLNRGDADVANGFTTDPNIAQTQLIVLSDDRHYWPDRHPAPIVRIAALHAHPRMSAILDRMSRSLSLYALQRMNMRRVVLDMDPYDTADEFVTRMSK